MRKPNSLFSEIRIFGLGRTGRCLALTFQEKGVPVRVWDRDGRKMDHFMRRHGIRPLKSGAESKGALSVLCVSDDAVASVARLMTGWGEAPGCAVHTSGALSLQPLEPLRRKGWSVGKLHPIYAFPVRPKPLPAGVTFGVRGDGPAFVRRLFRLCGALKGKGVEIRRGGDAAYHLACVGAGNFLFAQMAFAVQLMERSVEIRGDLERAGLFRPLVESSMENLETDGFAAGLTGPVARNDAGTVALHKAYLKRHAPDLLPFYLASSGLLRRGPDVRVRRG